MFLIIGTIEGTKLAPNRVQRRTFSPYIRLQLTFEGVNPTDVPNFTDNLWKKKFYVEHFWCIIGIDVLMG
jgi:hypothetical protein